MRDVVIVPTYERPEYAWVCLEYLSRARGIEDKEVWLCQDSHEGESANILLRAFPVADFGYSIFGDRFAHKVQVVHDTYGNSRNLVGSLRAAYHTGAERIFLVEDDIMVAPDVFEWHEEVLRYASPLVSCATAVNKSAHFPINGRYAMDESIQDPNAYYTSHSAYSSHCVAYTRQNLGSLLDRIDHAFYLGGEWEPGAEQDLLVQKIMQSGTFPNRGSAWPYVPRAFNVGFYSYHISGTQFSGSLAGKVIALRETITNPDKLKRMAFGNQAVTPVPAVFEERWVPKLHQPRTR